MSSSYFHFLVVLGVLIVGVAFGFGLGRVTVTVTNEVPERQVPPERYVVKRLASSRWQVVDVDTMAVVSDHHHRWSNAWNVAQAMNRRALVEPLETADAAVELECLRAEIQFLKVADTLRKYAVTYYLVDTIDDIVERQRIAATRFGREVAKLVAEETRL